MKLRKFNITAICISLFFGSMLFFHLPHKTEAMKDFFVSVEPSVSGEVAEFEFHVTLEKKIGVHERFFLHFPAGTMFNPPLPKDEKQLLQRRKEITEAIQYSVLNSYCPSCMGLTLIRYLENGQVQLTIGTPRSFDPKDEECKNFSIFISKEAGITTPSTPGLYKYGIYDSEERDYVESKVVEITSMNKNNAFCWFENPYITNPTGLKLKVPFCLTGLKEIKLTLSENEHFSFGSYLTDFSGTEENRGWIYSQIWFQGKLASCFGEELKISSENNSIILLYKPISTLNASDGITIHFQDTLEMQCLKEGVLQFNGQIELTYAESNECKQEIFPLRCNENYIFASNM